MLGRMAKPISTIEEILLLRPGASLEGLETGSTNDLVREFQRILGGGQLCEELDVYDFEGAERLKKELPISEALDSIDNRSGLNAEAVSCLWPVFGHGDGHTFYYCAAEERFLAHYHDPDILENIGNSLFQATNVALDANFNFIPEDFSPVYWKPRSLYNIWFGGCGHRISPEQFLAAIKEVAEPSHMYCGSGRGDIIWANQYSHLHYVMMDDVELGPTVDARFYSFQPSPEVDHIAENLRLLARKLELEIN